MTLEELITQRKAENARGRARARLEESLIDLLGKEVWRTLSNAQYDTVAGSAVLRFTIRGWPYYFTEGVNDLGDETIELYRGADRLPGIRLGRVHLGRVDNLNILVDLLAKEGA